MSNTETGHRTSGHFLGLVMVFAMLLAIACGDAPVGPADTPTPPAGMFSILPTTEPPVAGDQFGIVIDLATTPTQMPVPTATPEPTPTQMPDPTATSEPAPTQTPEPTATPEPTPTQTPAPTFTPVPTATPYPTSTPYPTPTTQPTQEPTVTPGLTPTPELTATTEPTGTPDSTSTPESGTTPGSSDNSLLCEAVMSDDYSVVRRLVRVADVNVECPNGQLPLYLAVIADNFLLIEALAESGANVNARHSDGNPLLYHAIVQGD